MKNNHRGDSLPKKIARLESYAQWRAWFGEKAFAKMRFLYLASFEGGDASVLQALGVPAANQLAVDFDGQSLSEFRRRYPEIPTHLGDVGGLPHAEKFDCVFLDFCSNLSERTIRTVNAVGEKNLILRESGTIFAFALQRAREVGWKDRIEAKSQANLADSERIFKNEGLLSSLSIMPKGTRARAIDGRSGIVYDAVSDALMKKNAIMLTLTKLYYCSVDPEEKKRGKPGTPLVIASYLVRHHSTKSQFTKYGKFKGAGMDAARTHLHLVHEWDRISIACQLNRTYEFDPSVSASEHERLVRLATLESGHTCDLTGMGSKATLLRAIKLCDRVEIDPAKALNLTPATVAATRAHGTMGTYDADDEAESRIVRSHLESQASLLGLQSASPSKRVIAQFDDRDFDAELAKVPPERREEFMAMLNAINEVLEES